MSGFESALSSKVLNWKILGPTIFALALVHFFTCSSAFGDPIEAVLFEDNFEDCCSLDPFKWSAASSWSRAFSGSASQGSYHASNTSTSSFNHLRTVSLTIPEGATLSFDYDSFTRYTNVEARIGFGAFSTILVAPATGFAGPKTHSFDFPSVYFDQTATLQWVKESGSTDYARIDDVRITSPVPEPESIAIVGSALLLLLLVFVWKRRGLRLNTSHVCD